MSQAAQQRVEIRRPVSKPAKPLPKGAWDCHAHVFGPYDRYPLLENPPYQPPLSPCEDYIGMLDTVGFDRGVLVHPSANGWDNSTTLDAVKANWPRLRGVAVLPVQMSDAEMQRQDRDGMRGVRITDHGHASGKPGTLAMTDIEALAPRFRGMGWHFQIWATQGLIAEYFEKLKAAAVPVIFDHMAFCDVGRGVDAPEFQRFLSMMEDSDFWIKLTPGRVSKAFPEFEEVRPFHEAYVERFPDRLVFGSDWAFIGNDATLPDVGKMVDLFDRWTPDEAIRQEILVSNPDRFYGAR